MLVIQQQTTLFLLEIPPETKFTQVKLGIHRETLMLKLYRFGITCIDTLLLEIPLLDPKHRFESNTVLVLLQQ